MRIEKGQTLKITGNREIRELIENFGTIEFDTAANAKLITNNLINFGLIKMGYADSFIHELGITGIDNNLYKGEAMNPYETLNDRGIWNMGAGVMDIKAASKIPFTHILGGVKAGENKISVKDASGWKIGDVLEITIVDRVPEARITETKNPGCRYWDNGTKSYVDNFIKYIEIRTISAINGLVITLNKALEYDHLQLATEPNMLAPNGRLFMPSAINRSRNVKLHGESATKTAHIFTSGHDYDSSGNMLGHRNQLMKIDGAEIYWMGVRKFQGNPKGMADVVTGRYAMHFHHCGDGTAGSYVKNCAFHDNNGRCLVPHMANGISFLNNSISFNLGDAYWYDFQSMSHDTNTDGNFFNAILWDGNQEGGTCALLGIGDGNKYNNNTHCYANQGDPDGSGAIQWPTDSEGVYQTHRNIIYCTVNADWTWQNSGRSHTIEEQIAVMCAFGVTHGAYGNLYQYIRCESYGSLTKVRASGPTFMRCVYDAMNRIFETTYIQTSAVGGPNNFHECEFKNAFRAITFDAYPHNESFATPRTLSLVNNKYVNIKEKYKFIRSNGGSYPGIVPNLSIRSQEGNSVQIVRAVSATNLNETTNTSVKFAPDKFGTGDGLRAEFYKGMNFETKVGDYVKALVREEDWRIDLPKMPNGAHYKFILPDKVNQAPFSVRFSGQIESYYTAPHRFRLYGGSGFRLWIADKLVIDAPGNKHDNAEYKDSPLILMVAGKRVNVKIEVYEPGDRNMGIVFNWEAPGYFGLRDVETSQLYSLTITTPPVEPTIYKSVRMEKEYIRNNCGAGFTGSKYMFVVAAGMFISTISQADADSKALAHLTTVGQAEADTLGLCTKDPIVEPVKELKADAGLDFTSESAVISLDGSGSTGDIKFINWYHDLGPVGWNIVSQNTLKTDANRLTPGQHLFRLVITGTDGRKAQDSVLVTIGKKVEEPVTFKSKEQAGTNTCIDGTVITAKVEAGKYTEATQALADAKALQELNRLLANCPIPWFTADLPNGKKLYIFGTAEPYKFIVK